MEGQSNPISTSFLVVLLVFSLLSLPTVQADGPTDVQFVGANALTYSGADEFGALTLNSTVRQGDHLFLEIPVENIGSVAQVASIVLNVSQENWNHTMYFDDVSIEGMSTHVFTSLSSMHVDEGLLEVSISLNNTTLFLNDSIQVGPPPLPNVHVDIQLLSTSFVAGDIIHFNITSNNLIGERTFNGMLYCLFLGQEVYNDVLVLGVGQETTNNLSISAKPGMLECELQGDRNQSNHTNSAFSLEDLQSAEFGLAGASGFTILGGPHHSGDDVEVSIILRNQGDASGNVQLKVVHDSIEHASNLLFLDTGSAGELKLVFEDMNEGVHNLTWFIESTDGIVPIELQGTETLTIFAPQQMFVELEAIEGDNGVQLSWNASITNGPDREVKLRYGYRNLDSDVYVNEQLVTLGSGTLVGQTMLGDVPSDTVVVRMEPVGWTASTNSYIATASLEANEATYSMEIDPITLPREPIEGKEVTVTIALANIGTSLGPSGMLYLTDSDGFLFGQLATEPLSAGSTRNVDVTFLVPKGNEILLTAEWNFDATSIEDELSILISAQIADDESGEIPFAAIGSGVAIACCIIFVLHLRRGTTESDTPKKVKKTESKPKQTKAEPVEKSCPACERKLRIPGDYTGTVRCPDCSEKFQVEAEESFDLDEELDSIGDSEPEPSPSIEEKVQISCPQCDSNLRVPSTYKGSVRCPSCSNVFSAA